MAQLRCYSVVFTTFILLGSLFHNPAFAQSDPATDFPAAGLFNLDSQTLCFPVQVQADSIAYDVCLVLLDSMEGFNFALSSATERAQSLSGIASFSDSEGLKIPLVRTSNGLTFTNVTFNAVTDPSSGRIIFSLTGGLDVTPSGSKSIARVWNEKLLDAIRSDVARPTVHSRNLFHTSVVMYDAWAVFDATAEPYMLGKTLNGFDCPFSGFTTPEDTEVARQEAISFAAYRLLSHRFAKSPGSNLVAPSLYNTLVGHSMNPAFNSLDYTSGSPAALGNYIAQCMIDYGLQDGANEQNNYAARNYIPINSPLNMANRGTTDLLDPNRWQPLAFLQHYDECGMLLPDAYPKFVSPEWGEVRPFALHQGDQTIFERDGIDTWVYHDPGQPPYLQDQVGTLPMGEFYKWGFQLVAQWSSHLDPNDGVIWDISPASIGNIQSYPLLLGEYADFYNRDEGGDTSVGHEINPVTGQPYESQLVPRGDYVRVLAEFWADGPKSETPPGHWFTILNYVNDHPLMEKRFAGEGPLLNDLEWDVKAYFTLGGAMHDAAVTAWSIKGWYDYIRPLSAIRYLAGRGQSSDPGGLNYDPEGIQLIPGFIEQIQPGDPLLAAGLSEVGDIKLYAWRGPENILNPDTDTAGAGWLRAEDWSPYQRATFVTPPFAGYISGHSTFSRTAAHVMTLLTGDEFFPGGMGEFHAPRNKFLIFEEGPSVDVTLQWATYMDASDQTSLSRIWGGIHPPADDIPGRFIGDRVGPDAFHFAEHYFNGTATP